MEIWWELFLHFRRGPKEESVTFIVASDKVIYIAFLTNYNGKLLGTPGVS